MPDDMYEDYEEQIAFQYTQQQPRHHRDAQRLTKTTNAALPNRSQRAAAQRQAETEARQRNVRANSRQSMERILKRYQACNSIHITSLLFSDPRLCAASRKAPTTSRRWTLMTLRKTSRKQYGHYHNHDHEKDTPAFAITRLCIWVRA